ncbi:MAG: hypothetical protein HRU09_05875 [Oligoflexales bacterium]|nr:hypothetical protein [Oligoflexales bacterium]
MKFKDYNHNFFSEFFYPVNQQVTYHEILYNGIFTPILDQQSTVTLIRLNKQSLEGHLNVVGKKLVFCSRANNSLHFASGETVIISMYYQGQTYYCQARFDSIQNHVNGRSFELTLAPPHSSRYYKRFELEAPAVVNEVPIKIVDKLLLGTHRLRRFRGRNSRTSKNFTICEDFLADNKTLNLKHMVQRNTPLLSGKIVNISQGGCQIILDGESTQFARQLRNDSIIYIQTSLTWGRLSSSIRSLAQVKTCKQFQNTIKLHCAFVDSLPRIPQKLKYLDYQFLLRFGEPVSIKLNNKHKMMLQSEGSVRLPLGIHDIEIRWSSGRISNQRLDLRNYNHNVLTFRH